MSIMFLEPGYSEPGHVHQGQLQLVEVSGAGWRPTSLWNPAWPRKAKRGPDCCAHSCWKVVQEQDRAGPTLASVVARGQRSQLGLCVSSPISLSACCLSSGRRSESFLSLETWLLPPSCRLTCLLLRCLLKDGSDVL